MHVSIIDKKINLFDPKQDIVDIANSGIMEDWNNLKESLFRKVARVKSAHTIYNTIYRIQSSTHNELMENTIFLGKKVYDYLISEDFSTFSLSEIDLLPSNLLNNNTNSDFKKVICKYIEKKNNK